MVDPSQKRLILISVAAGVASLAAACLAYGKYKAGKTGGDSKSSPNSHSHTHSHSHGGADSHTKTAAGSSGKKSESTIRPVSNQPRRGYTKEELSQYDGVKKPRIFVSLKRKVYEVAPQFYGPGAHYHCFAGTEASRSLAKSLLTKDEANKYWVDCTEEELETLDDYVAKFESKYPVVGWYIPDKSFYEI